MADCESCNFESVCIMPDFVRNDLKNCKVYEPKKKQTNADRIRAMSDEELAEWISGTVQYWDDGERIINMNGTQIGYSKEDVLEWLQSEVCKLQVN